MAVDRGVGDEGVSRRGFSRLLGVGGLATLVDPRALVRGQAAPLGAAPPAPDETYWRSVRAQFLMPADLIVFNAANLCPSSAPVIKAVADATHDVDRDPSMPNRRKMSEGKEETRRRLAVALRVTPEDIVITRNTTEGNNFVSSGVELKAGDEVLLSDGTIRACSMRGGTRPSDSASRLSSCRTSARILARTTTWTRSRRPSRRRRGSWPSPT